MKWNDPKALLKYFSTPRLSYLETKTAQLKFYNQWRHNKYQITMYINWCQNLWCATKLNHPWCHCDWCRWHNKNILAQVQYTPQQVYKHKSVHRDAQEEHQCYLQHKGFKKMNFLLGVAKHKHKKERLWSYQWLHIKSSPTPGD